MKYPLKDEDIVPGDWSHSRGACALHGIDVGIARSPLTSGMSRCVQCMCAEQLTLQPFKGLEAAQAAGSARLPTDASERKDIPLSAVLDYFPDALCDLARLIRAGQKQHNTPGWARDKSADHADCELRHFLERGTRDTDGMRHSTKRAWRALADLQIEIEKDEGLPKSRGSV